MYDLGSHSHKSRILINFESSKCYYFTVSLLPVSFVTMFVHSYMIAQGHELS